MIRTIVAGPSAVGKYKLIEGLQDTDAHIQVAVSCTTRDQRAGEVDGLHYRFQKPAEFWEVMRTGGFLEFARNHGYYYGTPVSEATSATGLLDILFEIDIKGARRLKKRLLEKNLGPVHTIFILPPSRADIEKRMKRRGREVLQEDMERRLLTACREIRQASWFDHWILNDDLKVAIQDFKDLIGHLRKGVRPDPARFRNKDLLRKVQTTFQ